MNPETQPQPETSNTPTTEPILTPSEVSPAAEPVTPTPLTPMPAAPTIATAAENPGQTLSIIGLVLAFLFPLVGIFLSVIGRNKSKKAGASTTVGTVGVVLNIISLVISLLYTVVVMLAASSAISQKALEQACKEDSTYSRCSEL